MASDYCYSTEMKRAIERHDQGSAHVIPILLRPLYWDDAPFAKLQIIPTNVTPVTSWPNHDDAFYDVTGHISRFLARSLNPQTPSASKYVPTERSYATPNPPATPSTPQVFPVASVETQKTNTLSDLPSLQLIAKPEAITILRTLTGYTQDVLSVALSADGQTVANGDINQEISLWNVKRHNDLCKLKGHKEAIACMALSADGRILASGSLDGTVKLWNVPKGKLLHTLAGSTKSVTLSTDGLILASANYSDGTIKLWNTQTGKLLHTTTIRSGSVSSVALSADRRTLASGNSDGTINIWGVEEEGTSLEGEFLHVNIPPYNSFQQISLSRM